MADSEGVHIEDEYSETTSLVVVVLTLPLDSLGVSKCFLRLLYKVDEENVMRGPFSVNSETWMLSRVRGKLDFTSLLLLRQHWHCNPMTTSGRKLLHGASTNTCIHKAAQFVQSMATTTSLTNCAKHNQYPSSSPTTHHLSYLESHASSPKIEAHT